MRANVSTKATDAPARALTTEFERRLAAVDWYAAAQSLDAHGCATIPALIAPAQCTALTAMYDERERFRSRVVMERLRFGVGEYKYFAMPLPPIVAALRTAIYPHLAPIANRWLRAMGREEVYPAELERFIEICRRAGIFACQIRANHLPGIFSIHGAKQYL